MNFVDMFSIAIVVIIIVGVTIGVCSGARIVVKSVRVGGPCLKIYDCEFWRLWKKKRSYIVKGEGSTAELVLRYPGLEELDDGYPSMELNLFQNAREARRAAEKLKSERALIKDRLKGFEE